MIIVLAARAVLQCDDDDSPERNQDEEPLHDVELVTQEDHAYDIHEDG